MAGVCSEQGVFASQRGSGCLQVAKQPFPFDQDGFIDREHTIGVERPRIRQPIFEACPPMLRRNAEPVGRLSQGKGAQVGLFAVL